MYVVRVLCFLWSVQIVYGQLQLLMSFPQCKWANEECSTDAGCCSQKCIQKNPGTTKRCSQSSLGGHCLYRYHCENYLMCGDKKQCCAQYWETCSKHEHCCDPEHRCVRADGFVYKNCLYRSPGGAGIMRLSPFLIIIILYNIFEQ